MRKSMVKLLAIYLIGFIFLSGVASKESFAYIAADIPSSRADDMAKVERLLEAKVVSEKLLTLGLTAEEINTRLDKLSDDELHQFTKNVDALYPGGDGISALIGLLILVVVILVLLHLTGHKVILEPAKK